MLMYLLSGAMIALLQTQPAQVGPEAVTQPAAPKFEGPMRVEPVAVMESRLWLKEGDRRDRSRLAVQCRVTGERLTNCVKMGRLIFEELKDDTGAVLISAEELTEAQREKMRDMQISPQIVQAGGVLLAANAELPKRSATKLMGKGYVQVAYSNGVEEVMIDNPFRFEGEFIDHARLKELGVKIRVPKIGEEVDIQKSGKAMPLEIVEGQEKIESVQLFDAWFRQMRTRAKQMKSKADKPIAVYEVVAGADISEDTQIVIRLYANVETEKVSFQFEQELP
ncbi:MAG: hypothetical protein KDA32_15035 [Phycisphaerales bacterium]|nr:hypothetical protein [Phycisphaerales bacterium]